MKLASLALALMLLTGCGLAEPAPTPIQVKPAFTWEIGEPAPTPAPRPKVVTPGMSFGIGEPALAPFKRYDNLVYHYSYSLPGDFELQKEYSQLEGDEKVYDGRNWASPDRRFLFFTQLKQPSFASLEDEIEQLPFTLEAARRDIEADGGRKLRYIHDDVVLHELPAGKMLENATSYEMPVGEGQGYQEFTQVYLDFYDGRNEYIFGLIAKGVSYEESLKLLLRIGQTVETKPLRIR